MLCCNMQGIPSTSGRLQCLGGRVRKGQSLFYHLYVKGTPFCFSTKLSIARQVAQAMGYLHAKGIVSGKLCSRNIFLESKVKVAMTDPTIEQKPMVKGSYAFIPKGDLCYLSPELMQSLRIDDCQLMSEAKTKASDVYTYGTLLYEIFAEDYPLRNCSSEVMIWLISKGYQTSVDSLCCPQDIKDTIKLCWHFNPNQRPDFQEVMTILKKQSVPRLQRQHSFSEPDAIDRLRPMVRAGTPHRRMNTYH